MREKSVSVTMQMSDDGLRFLIAREGNVSSMYNDSAGHCTVGVGHLVHKRHTEFGTAAKRMPYSAKADPHAGMTQAQASHWDSEKPYFTRLSTDQVMDLLHQDVPRFEAAVQAAVKVDLSQSQFDALVSFSFNVGPRAIAHSTLLKLVNEKKFSSAATEFNKWVKAGGEVSTGLMNRRSYEQRLFLNGDYAAHEHKALAKVHRRKHHAHKPAKHSTPVVPLRLG